VDGALRYAKLQNAQRVLGFLQRLATDQPVIARVHVAWNRAYPLVRPVEAAQTAQSLLVRRGAFAGLVDAIASIGGVGAWLLQWLRDEPASAVVENYRALIQTWSAPFQVHTAIREVDLRELAADQALWGDGREEGLGAGPSERAYASSHYISRAANHEVQKLKGDVLQAMQASDFGAFKRAVHQLEEFQRRFSGPARLAQSMCHLAASAKDMGRYDLQLDLANRAIRADAHDPFTYNTQADSLLRLGRFDEALDVYGQTMIAHPQNVVARSGYAETLRLLGRSNEALEVYGQTMNAHPQDAVARCGYAKTLRSLGRSDEALEVYGQTVNAHPQNMVALCGYAETLRSLGRSQDALEAYGQTVNAHPQNEFARNGYAETLRFLGRSEEALEIYGQTMNAHPQNAVALCGYAETLRFVGRSDEALEVYMRTMESHPQDTFASCGYAETLRSLGRSDEALEVYEQAMDAHPQNAVARNGYAETLRSLGRSDEALAALQPIENAPERDWIGYHIYGMLLLRAGRLDEAVRVFEHGFVRTHARQRDYFASALAIARIRRRDYRQAAQILQQVTSPEAQTPANALRVHVYMLNEQNPLAVETMKLLPKVGERAYMVIRGEFDRRLLRHEPRGMSDDELRPRNGPVNDNRYPECRLSRLRNASSHRGPRAFFPTPASQ
jgi:pentatricopeptide repeat protein